LQKAHMCRAEMPLHSSWQPPASAACTAGRSCRAMFCSRARAGGMLLTCCSDAMAPSGQQAAGGCGGEGGLRQVAAAKGTLSGRSCRGHLSLLSTRL